jgi:peptide-methionine (R)-S-oxide reductase
MLRSVLLGFLGLVSGCHANATLAASTPRADKIVKSNDEWKRTLTPAQYNVLRERGTERAFSNAYWNDHRHALYRCAGCGLLVFKSEDKFESGTGWPSFTRPASADVVAPEEDQSHGMVRSEVHCARCGGHLGHVFDDGPAPTGLRYCINSAALTQEVIP